MCHTYVAIAVFTAEKSNILGDIAVDWVADVFYRVDSSWARIEVLDLDNLNGTELLRTGPNTNVKASVKIGE